MSRQTSPHGVCGRAGAGLTALTLAMSGCASLQPPAAYAWDARLDFPVFTNAVSEDAGSAARDEDAKTTREPAVASHGTRTTQPSRIVAAGFGLVGDSAGDGDPADNAVTSLPNGEVLRADDAAPGVDPRWRKASPALFWTGIAVGSLGATFLIGGGITGSATQRQVRGAYDDGATKAELDRLIARGEVANDLVIAGSVLALAGYALAVVVAGIDEKRCGAVLRKARRRECESH